MGTTEPVAGWTWAGEARGALHALAAMLPFVLSYGFIAYGTLGPAAVQAGLAASVVAVVLGGALLALLCRDGLPSASPSASTCLILGAAVLRWGSDPALAGRPALVLALAGVAVAGCGLLLLGFGLLRAGRLVRYVPHPVLAGFVNGVAVLIVLSQLAPALGLAPDRLAREGWGALAAADPAALAVAGASAALALGLARVAPRWPAALLGLAIAGAAVAALQAAGALPGLATLGPLRPPWPEAATLAPLALPDGLALLRAHAAGVAATALLLALIGGLETVLNLAAVDAALQRRSDPDRLLVALGATNLLLAPLGALPVVNLRLRAMAAFNGGGRSARSTVLGSLALAAAFTLGLPLLERCAPAVVAGVVVMLAWTLVDRWSLDLLRERRADAGGLERRLALGVVGAVCAVTVLQGFAAGVALGVLLSFVLLVRSLSRSLVRMRLSAAARPSRRLYAAPQEQVLGAARPAIELVELEGALFFGNTERLQRELEPLLAPGRRAVVLDLRRVGTLDASAAVALARLRTAAQEQGVRLLLAGVTPDNRHGQALAAHGQLAGWLALPARLHADADLATEAAERAVLDEAGLPAVATPLALTDCALLSGLAPADAQALAARMPARTLAAGERLFAQGDPGDALYVLSAGSVSVRDARTGQRFASFSAGMTFGETALLDGGGRTAEAVADEPAVVHALERGLLEALEREAPHVAARLHRNLALHLSQRLREAASAWRAAAS